MRAKPACRDRVVPMLLAASDGLRDIGCDLYLVSVDAVDPDLIWVMEVWESKERHSSSLELPATKAAIGAAMPLLTGEFTGQELEVVGGLGG
jgi:quinol monooxygenase YgiN